MIEIPRPPARRPRPRSVPALLVLILLGGLAAGIGYVAMWAWQQSRTAKVVVRDSGHQGWLPAQLPRREDLHFRLPSLDGRQLGPRDFPGKVVVVEFGATWCLPCHLQARVLEAMQRDLGAKGLQVLTVDVGEPRRVVEEFYAGKPQPYPILLDERDTMSAAFAVSVLPTLMVLDREGRVVYLKAGIVDRAGMEEIVGAAGL